MALRSRQKLWHKVAFSWITIGLLILVILLLTRAVLGMYQKNNRANHRAQSAHMELKKVQEREVSLRKDLEYIKTSKGMEEELRQKFDVARDGEHLLVIVDKEVEPKVEQEAGSWLGGLWRKLIQ